GRDRARAAECERGARPRLAPPRPPREPALRALAALAPADAVRADGPLHRESARSSPESEARALARRRFARELRPGERLLRRLPRPSRKDRGEERRRGDLLAAVRRL